MLNSANKTLRPPYFMTHLPGVMGTLVYLICAAAVSFAVLAQAAVAQGTNTTLPLTYPGQVLQGDGSQTCPLRHNEG